jgi:hypothetical protein
VEEHKLSMFEDRVLRKIFGPKRDKITADWTKLHNEELHPYQILLKQSSPRG